MVKLPCLLTEFSTKNLKQFVSKHPDRIPWAGTLFALCASLMTLALAYFAKVLFFTLTFSVESKDNSIPSFTPITASHCMGFLGEPNWGLYFIFFLPVAVWFALKFLVQGSKALSEIEPINRSKPLSEYAADLNRAIFDFGGRFRGMAALVLFVIITIISLSTQYASFASTKAYNRSNFWDVGQTESPHLLEWVTFYNDTKMSPDEQYKLLANETELGQFTSRAGYRNVFIEINKQFSDQFGKTRNLYDDLTKDPKKLKLVVAVHPIMQSRLPTANFLFWSFIVMEQSIISASYVLLIFFLIKVTIFWSTIGLAIYRKRSMVLLANCEAPDSNYGLSSFVPAINSFWKVLLLVEIYVVFKLSNTTTGNQLVNDHYAGATTTLVIDVICIIILPLLGYGLPKLIIENKLKRICPKARHQSLVVVPGWKSNVLQIVIGTVLAWQLVALIWGTSVVQNHSKSLPSWFKSVPEYIYNHSDPSCFFGAGRTLCEKTSEIYMKSIEHTTVP